MNDSIESYFSQCDEYVLSSYVQNMPIRFSVGL